MKSINYFSGFFKKTVLSGFYGPIVFLKLINGAFFWEYPSIWYEFSYFLLDFKKRLYYNYACNKKGRIL